MFYQTNQQSANNPRIITKGYVAGIRFRNEENGWTVFTISPDERIAAFRQRHVPVVGIVSAIQESEYVEVHGEIEVSKFGPQIKAESIRPILPDTEEGILALLSSKMFPVTKLVAKRIVSRFGTKTLDIIENSPEDLLEIKGISAIKSRKNQKNNILSEIVSTFSKKREKINSLEFCLQYGLGVAVANRIYERLQENTIRTIQANPYILIQLPSIGFKTADHIAMNLGIAPDDPRRAKAAIIFVLREFAEGSCGLPADILFAKAEKNLSVPEETCASAVDDMIAEGTLIRDTIDGDECLFNRYDYAKEQNIATRIVELSNAAPTFFQTR